jgi:hypothetical protein
MVVRIAVIASVEPPGIAGGATPVQVRFRSEVRELRIAVTESTRTVCTSMKG